MASSHVVGDVPPCILYKLGHDNFHRDTHGPVRIAPAKASTILKNKSGRCATLLLDLVLIAESLRRRCDQGSGRNSNLDGLEHLLHRTSSGDTLVVEDNRDPDGLVGPHGKSSSGYNLL